MDYEGLPTTPTADELVDRAFSRAARAGRAKRGVEAQESMLQTASNVLSDNLRRVVTTWPDFDTVDPFYVELAATLVDVDALRRSLSNVGWAARKTKELGRDYRGRVRGKDPGAARTIRKQGFARMASVLEDVAADLERIGEARDRLRRLPEIDPQVPTIVVAGYPNVGKSSLVNALTAAHGDVAEYAFTTTTVRVGHLERDHVRYQLVDTPGLLDRPPAERNEIERQAVSALEHVADCVLFVVDPSETCGYPMAAQRSLREAVRGTFDDVPLITVSNKADLAVWDDAEFSISLTDGGDDDLEDVLAAAIEAIGYEPRLPFEG